MERELRAEVEKLRAARERLVRIELAAREELERDLHAGLQQQLVALAVKLQFATASADGATRAALEEVARDLQEARDEAARLALRIHPPLLAERGLGLALRSALVDARVEVAEDASISPEVAGVVYLSVVEALRQLPGSGAATVTVRAQDGELRFEIACAGGEDHTVGLDGVRQRLEALGGKLAVARRPDGGVRVSGVAPCRLEATRSRRGTGRPP